MQHMFPLLPAATPAACVLRSILQPPGAVAPSRQGAAQRQAGCNRWNGGTRRQSCSPRCTMHRFVIHRALLRGTWTAFAPGWPPQAPAAAAAAVSRRSWAASPATKRQRCRAYESPEVYDIAFNFRDFSEEVRAARPRPPVAGVAAPIAGLRRTRAQTAYLLAMHERHSSGALQHFLEVACGPARHASGIAAASGAAATALDASLAMLAYARQLAEAAGVADKLRFVEADMTAGGTTR